MRVSFVALGLLALLAVAYAEDVAEPAEYHRKSKHSHKKRHDDEGDSPEGDYPGFNRPYDHIHEHSGNCRGSRDVTSAQVTGNNCFKGAYPPPPGNGDPAPADATCPTPQFCGSSVSYPINDCTCAAGEWYRFGPTEVAAHFKNQPGPFPMVDVKRQSFECVDARGQNPMLGTPGGDLAEAMAAAMTLLKLTGKKPGTSDGDKIIDQVFSIFANQIATPERPLYFHSDDGSLRRLFADLGAQAALNTKPSIFPWRGPEPSTGTLANAWIAGLKKTQFNGCGHVRLQLDVLTSKDYSIATTNAADGKIRTCATASIDITNAGCISAKAIAEQIIEKYFRFWWFTPDNSKARRKIAFAVEGVLEGPLLGKAVTIIDKQKRANGGEVCPGYYPLVRPTFAASQVFVYHDAAIKDFRGYATNRFFEDLLEDYSVRPSVFKAAWDEITGLQLGSTLTDLSPANRVGLFTTTVPISPIEKGDHDYGHKHHHHTSGHHYYSDTHDYSPDESNYDDSY